MAYNKEYYEIHKEQMKMARDKYRKGTPEAVERIRQINRERYNNLPYDKKQLLLKKMRNRRRTKSPEYNKIQCRIDYRKRQLKQYTNKLEEQQNEAFILKMKDTWDSSDFKYSDEIYAKMMEIKAKIKQKQEEIDVLSKEKEKYK